METNNHQIVDYSAVLEAQYGALGTPERAKFDEEAYAFYTSQILLDAHRSHQSHHFQNLSEVFL